MGDYFEAADFDVVEEDLAAAVDFFGEVELADGYRAEGFVFAVVLGGMLVCLFCVVFSLVGSES